ncbi:MAG: glutamate-5-semialdehyde dehydrogenase [Dysgonamonadaceae bacterium]|jgi:glutamate-5-semialdehyde dehydrogenase|nr:glutamate-5-semialdehyde dehydrogenase [Dysgonamonadaceae bacterium]
MKFYSEYFEKAKEAGAFLVTVSDKKINEILLSVGEKIIEKTDYILSENKKDLDRMSPADPKYDRLRLTPERIEGIVADLRSVAELPSPVGRVLKETVRPNGMKISKISVPFGLIGIIYEARPNVSLDVFSLCFKSGNACILKGGSDAAFSNPAIVENIREVLEAYRVPPACCTLLPPEREATTALLHAEGWVDLVIPRGNRGLIDFVRKNAKIPVIETGAGICHTYFDKDGDKEIGRALINNAKTRRVGVCNALDCLVIHEGRLQDLFYLCSLLQESKVIIYADNEAYRHLAGVYQADLLQHAGEDSFGTEFLDYKMSVKTVACLDEALTHIARYSSGHSECIISENPVVVESFLNKVDAACVYENVSTAFTDGAQFGLGAEIGISTQKLHARGPMALEELTSYKWIVRGKGQIRK